MRKDPLPAKTWLKLQGLSQLQSQEGHAPTPAGTSLPSSFFSPGETSWNAAPATSLPKASLCIWPPCRLLGAVQSTPDHAHPSILLRAFPRDAELGTWQPMDVEPEEPNQNQRLDKNPGPLPPGPEFLQFREDYTESSSHKPTASLCCSQSLLASGCPWQIISAPLSLTKYSRTSQAKCPTVPQPLERNHGYYPCFQDEPPEAH